MGANQSSGTDSSGADRVGQGSGEVKICYYELLGIDPKASEEEIKKAYRKKALELHPDRNYGNVEATAKQFADVQSAYEILSDPQERAWYDTHRDSILRGGDDSGEHYEQNVRVTTAGDIMRLFSKFNSRIDFSDSSTGFYGALRSLFANLAREEEAAYGWEGLEPVKYPSFGYKDDNYEDVVRPFYAMWNSFATKKSFSWKDLYRYSEAPDRKIRRLMEKENKRFRDEGIREFNDAVRSLVAFVRKRDPRFRPNKQSEADRQKVLKEAANAQAARSRAANQAKSMTQDAIPEWMRASAPEIGDISDDEWATSNVVKNEVECVVCSKTFKSEKQYDAHERSKKHVKAVQHMQRLMQQEDKDLNLDEPGRLYEPSVDFIANTDIVQEDSSEMGLRHPETSTDERNLEGTVETLDNDAPKHSENDFEPVINESDQDADQDEDQDENDDYAPREKVEKRLAGQDDGIEEGKVTKVPINVSHIDALSKKLADESLIDDSETRGKPRMGKAKERRAKKAAQKSCTTNVPNAELECATCQETFPSKTRLFTHIKDLRHAQPVQKAIKGGKGERG